MNYKLVNEAVSLLWGKDAPLALKNVFNRLAKIEHAGFEKGIIAALSSRGAVITAPPQDEWMIEEDEKPVIN